MVRNNTISMHFIRHFILVLIIPITVSGLLQSYILFQNTYESILNDAKRSIAKADLYFTLVVQNTENIANIVCFNSGVQKALTSGFLLKNAPDNYELWKEARESLIGNFIPYENIFSNAIIFNEYGNVVLSLYRFNENASLYDYEWFNTVKDSYGQGIWIPSHVDSYDSNSSQDHVITLAKKIRVFNLEGIETDLGYLVINISEQKLYNMFSNFVVSNSSSFHVQDRNGKIIIHSDNQSVGKQSGIKLPDNKSGVFFDDVNGVKKLISYYKNEKTGWFLVESALVSDIFGSNRHYLISTLLISMALLIIFIFVSVKFSNSISKPIHELEAQIGFVENGVFNMEFKIRKTNIFEIDRLVNRFKTMVQRLNSLIDEVYKSKIKEKELEAAVNQAELTSLQQQINPHFLYNTLDSINWMASLGANEEVSKMVTALSDFFRFSINRGINFVTIASEVENIKNYIFLQQIRFGPALCIEMDIQPEVNEYMTMKLLLQPVVENSIIHGIQSKVGGGEISIKIYKENDSIIFLVKDNGCGMDQATIDRIMSPDKKIKSVGLRNVIQRLSLFFPDRYTFDIQSRLNVGTTVKISIPCFRDEEELKRMFNGQGV